MNIFREMNTNNKTKFYDRLDRDIIGVKDGDFIYAFITNETHGNGNNYIELKVVKYDDMFTGFIVKKLNDQGDSAIEIVAKTIFEKVSSGTKLKNGYCLTKEDAEIIKYMRVKEVMDDYCVHLGIESLEAFTKQFNEFKENSPEKFL